MRSIPGMVVLCPADEVEARAVVKAAYQYQGPVYMRFGRLAVPVFHDEADYKFEIGKGEVLREGSDLAILATGLEVAEAMKAAETLAAGGVQARVLNLCSIKPLDTGLVLKAAAECGRVVTCEEHSVIGGLGEAVCAAIAEAGVACKVKRVGVQDEFGRSGPAKELLARFGLDAAGIAAACRELLEQ